MTNFQKESRDEKAGILQSISESIEKVLNLVQKRSRLRILIGISVIVFMANVDPLIDTFINPEVPYFNEHHLAVGALTAFVTTVLFLLLSVYVSSLRRMMGEIKKLEGLLPICSSCHRIRSTDNQWHFLEKYISERTDATFTHSVCPECAKKLYPEMYGDKKAT